MFYVTGSGGVRCAVEDINPRGRNTVIFVHGWPLARELFEWQFNVLPEYNIRCITIDLRGFGDSDKPYGDYSYNTLADDLYCVIKRLGLTSPVTLLGFSMGGAVCVRYMARHSGYCVRRLVLAGAAAPSFVQRPGYPYGMTREQVDTLIASCYEDRFAAYQNFGQLCFARPVSDELRDWFRGMGNKSASFATIKTLESLRDEDLRADLSTIKVPTAIFHGVQDQVCPYPLAAEMKKGISDSFICSFESAGHCCFCDEKDAFNSALIDFIHAAG